MEHLSNSKLDVNWIESISGYEESLAKELYGSKAENSVIVINLAEDHGAKMIKLKDIIPESHIITCERGQWDHPGKITRIPSNNITMQPDPETGHSWVCPIHKKAVAEWRKARNLGT